MVWLWALFALLGGAALAIQAGVNAQLRTHLGHPILAALGNVLVAAVFLVSTIALLRPSADGVRGAARVPWWQWAGGVLGAIYLIVIIVLAPRLGAATMLALVVAGQLVTAVALDHFGLLGFPVQGITLWRAVGAVLLVAGVVLIRGF